MENTTIRIASGCYRKSLLELEIDGKRHKLEPKVAELLEVFLSSRNETLSREELINALWPSRVVTDDALNRCISILRARYQ